MLNNKKITAIILVAGNSTRFGKTTNKNFEYINEKAVLSYSLEAFNKNKYIDDILITIRKDDSQIINEILQKEKVDKNVKVILGGTTRKESVHNSIKTTNSDIVIIHDGARPLIKQDYINKCIESMIDYKGATIGVKSKDTIKITNENNIVINTTKRENTWIIQTPQCFDRKTLLLLHEKYNNENVTDDCMLLEKDNYSVKVLEGDYTNIKITTQEDLNIIKEFIKSSKTSNLLNARKFDIIL